MLAAATEPTLKHVIPSRGHDRSVNAVTSLGDDVFLVREYSYKMSSAQVEVYDARTFAFQRLVQVPELGENVYGLAACTHHNCLYVSDYDNNSVHRAGLSGRNVATKWFVASKPSGVSVNKEHNVVVACSGANKLIEYTTYGAPLREINLQACVLSPYHAVQLSTGNYMVSQNIYSAVSVVGVSLDGKVVRSDYVADVGGAKLSLSVTKNGDILVADTNNDRILSINSSLSSAEQLALPEPSDGRLQRPFGLYLDKSRSRLYVGEGRGKYRVLVFDNVKL